MNDKQLIIRNYNDSQYDMNLWTVNKDESEDEDEGKSEDMDKNKYDLTLAWNSNTNRVLHSSTEPRDPNKSYFATTDDLSKEIQLLSLSNKNSIRTLRGHSHKVQSVSTLKDGRIISISEDNQIKIWTKNEQDQYQCSATLTGHNQNITAIIELKEGLLISGSQDETLKVWDIKAENNECIATLAGHTGEVSSILELKDGRIVSTSLDSTFRVWDLRKSNMDKCVAILKGCVIKPSTIIIELLDGTLLPCTSMLAKEVLIWVPNNENGYNPQIISDEVTHEKLLIIGHKDGHILTRQATSTIKTWTKNSTNQYVCTDSRYLYDHHFDEDEDEDEDEYPYLPETKFNHHIIISYNKEDNAYAIYIWDSTYILDKRISKLAKKK